MSYTCSIVPCVSSSWYNSKLCSTCTAWLCNAITKHVRVQCHYDTYSSHLTLLYIVSSWHWKQYLWVGGVELKFFVLWVTASSVVHASYAQLLGHSYSQWCIVVHFTTYSHPSAALLENFPYSFSDEISCVNTISNYII